MNLDMLTLKKSLNEFQSQNLKNCIFKIKTEGVLG